MQASFRCRAFLLMRAGMRRPLVKVARASERVAMMMSSVTRRGTARQRAIRILALLLVAPVLLSCGKSQQFAQSPAPSGGQLHEYTGQMEPDDGQWVRATKDYANTRYSNLNQINTKNVSSLKVAWTFRYRHSTGTRGRTDCRKWDHVCRCTVAEHAICFGFDQARWPLKVEVRSQPLAGS